MKFFDGEGCLPIVIKFTFDVDFIKFIIYSTIGIAIWNCAFIYLGYAFGHLFLKQYELEKLFCDFKVK